MSALKKKFFKQKTQDPPSTGSGMHRNRGAFARSKSIDQQIESEREKRRHEVQLLILGGASSGKTTFIKQLRINHGDGFPEASRGHFVPFLLENLIDAFHVVLENMSERGIACADSESTNFTKELAQNYPKSNHYNIPAATTPCFLGASGAPSGGGEVYRSTSPNLSARDRPPPPDYRKLVHEHGARLVGLFADAGFRKCYQIREQFECRLRPAEEYFLNNLERVLKPGYVPTVQDILFVRQPTLGVQEHLFTTNGLQYRVIDVAGQQNQRKKWIHFFDGVTAVVFFVALNGYCENLEEDNTMNSLQDSLHTFGEVVGNKYLDRTDFILFLNKKDVYEQRIQTKPLTLCFPEYTGSPTSEETIRFVQSRFEDKLPKEKSMYVHVSCAIDTSLMKKIISDVMQIIIEINLRKASRPL